VTEDDWAEIEARELRLWVGEPVTGIWCPACELPSVIRIPVERDPGQPTGGVWFERCIECHALAEDAS
jgi:hypothetical protein